MAKAMTLFWVLVIIAMALVVGTAALQAKCNGDLCFTDDDCSTDDSRACCKVGTCPPDNTRGWCTEFYCHEDDDCGDGFECKELGECGEDRGYYEESAAPAPT